MRQIERNRDLAAERENRQNQQFAARRQEIDAVHQRYSTLRAARRASGARIDYAHELRDIQAEREEVNAIMERFIID